MKKRVGFNLGEEEVLSESEVGMEVMELLIPRKDFHKIGKMSDKQTGQLSKEVYRELADRITKALGNEGREAINRLKHPGNFRESPEGMTRNNIFKAAHALKMKLPSMMF